MSETVKVVVRCRPMNEREKGLGSKNVVFMDATHCQCNIVNPNDNSAPPKSFSFDSVYSTESATENLYNEIAYPLVEGVLEGYNATVFAYGQTGCGKSFTMQGIPDSAQHKGIIPRAFEHIFEAIETSDNIKYLVHASYLEIYNEEIRDLLGQDVKKRLDLKEHPDNGVYVSELSQHPVHNVHECEDLVEKGWRNRSVGATLMNADSSRSHSIFTINLEMMSEDAEHIRQGKLNLVDLAGSERQAKTGATGDRLKEATKINLSLSALGNVISALVDGKSKHIPYRDSKLTRLLQDSLGGNTKTLMVACVSPADNNYDETLSTLRYANRAKNIKNKPIINQDPKDALLSEYQEEIRLLKEMLQNQNNNLQPHGIHVGSVSRRASIIDLDSERDKIRQEYEQQLQSLRQSYETEQNNNARLQADVEKLRQQYQKDLEIVDKNLMVSPYPGQENDNNALSPEQQETLARLHEIEENMVGGEKAHDKDLKEKRQRKKKAAEKRSKVLAETSVSKSDDEDSNILLKAYDNIQEELRVKTEAFRKAKQKVKALEREITDIHSEFQNDRTDYLETIRRQDQQIKLLQGILDKIQPTIRRDCNYSNIDKIKADAIWSDEHCRWKLPDLYLSKTKLPPAGVNHNNGGNNSSKTQTNNNRVPSRTAPPRLPTDMDDDNEENSRLSILSKKFETNQTEAFTENYFKPKRATELLIKAQQDATRVVNIAQKSKSSPASNILMNWNNHFNTQNKGQPNIHTTLHHSWGSSPVQNFAVGPINGFFSSPEMSSCRRPSRLQALPIEVTSKAFKKQKHISNNGTTLDFS